METKTRVSMEHKKRNKPPKKCENTAKKMQPDKHRKTNKRNKRINQRKRGLINMNLTNLNEKQYEMLKRAYNRATKEGQEQFQIQGQPVLTKFAKYLLEYLENQRRTTGKRIYEPTKHDKTCPKCSYIWVSRVENVKACPKCKTRVG